MLSACYVHISFKYPNEINQTLVVNSGVLPVWYNEKISLILEAIR